MPGAPPAAYTLPPGRRIAGSPGRAGRVYACCIAATEIVSAVAWITVPLRAIVFGIRRRCAVADAVIRQCGV